VLLDLSLPDVHGLILCIDIKADMDIPIIAVSATSQSWEGTLSLRVGADDFVAKPFDLEELLARIAAVLRRSGRHRTTPSHSDAGEYRTGQLVVDWRHRRVMLGDEEVRLSATEFRLLGALAGQPGRAFSREELGWAAWGYLEAARGRRIDAHIRRLRMKLEGAATRPPAIVSVRTIGYRLLPTPAYIRVNQPVAA
jgi:DNA-binding response OmpR family regulator